VTITLMVSTSGSGGKAKGMKKNEARIEQRMKIEFESPVKVVTAYQKAELGYVYRALHRK